MGNPARKHSKGRTLRRRHSAFKATIPSIIECPNCHEMMLSHRVCKNCGQYDGKQVLAVADAE